MWCERALPVHRVRVRESLLPTACPSGAVARESSPSSSFTDTCNLKISTIICVTPRTAEDGIDDRHNTGTAPLRLTAVGGAIPSRRV